ncbi:hypothetical protein CLAIMM_01042 isoform 4, partial [Cladophialophora immunda]
KAAHSFGDSHQTQDCTCHLQQREKKGLAYLFSTLTTRKPPCDARSGMARNAKLLREKSSPRPGDGYMVGPRNSAWRPTRPLEHAIHGLLGTKNRVDQLGLSLPRIMANGSSWWFPGHRHTSANSSHVRPERVEYEPVVASPSRGKRP